jgi:uncharacterized membrane protein YhaH (DUF805 family)
MANSPTSNPANNPYTPPRAAVADVGGEETQEVKIFSASGRIGRLRYLAYGMGAALILMAVFMVLISVLGPAVAGSVLLLAYLPIVVMHVLWGIQRSHDMGWSGWTVLALLIPFAAFVWIFNPGTKGTNAYGAPPVPNTTGVKVLGFGFVLIIPLLGILAAIAIPSYQQYVERAKAAQQLEQPADR